MLKSFLAFPTPGKFNELVQELQDLPDCQVIPSDQKNVVILVTELDQPKLDDYVQSVSTLQCLSMVYGHI